MSNMIFTALASSSAGNAYIVDDRETRILLECGITHKKLKTLSGFSMSQFAACLVSHEHKDHAKAVRELIKDGMTLYMSEGTAEALETDGVELISSMEQFNIGSLDIVPFTTFHDAAEPLGFLIKSRVDGDVLAFATDTVNLRYQFPGLNILAIEANYDKEILARCEKMPEKVRYIKTGLLYEDDSGIPVYGLEIGQTNDVNGENVFSKFARFSADRLSFYDRNDTEVAYISDYRLYITNAEITGTLSLTGRFKIYYDHGLAFQWIGGKN